jgi:iron complex outermembrane receptor protein
LGTIVPPSSVFDVVGGSVAVTPKPTGVTTYQSGTVLKLKRVTLSGDVYYISYQNAYAPVTQTSSNVTSTDFYAEGNAQTKGFEAEANVYVTSGISFYTNFTVGSANYISSQVPIAGVMSPNPGYGLAVANTPSNTEAFGLTYQQKHFDLGIFDKRVGPMWNDNSPYNQVIPINPFSMTNVYFNYVLRNGSHFDQTKFRLSINNLFNAHNIVGVQPSTASPTFSPLPSDLLQLLPGRSITLTITPGYSSKR